MPVIYAHYRKEALTDQQVKDLIPKFNQIIINRMSCKEMQLVESQILLEFIPRSAHYFGESDLQVEIIGSDFPDRLARCNEWLPQIARDLKEVLPATVKCCGGVFMPHTHGWIYGNTV